MVADPSTAAAPDDGLGSDAAPDPPPSASTSDSGRASGPFSPRTLLTDSLVAAGVIAGFYALLYAVPLPPFGVPGYLLLVAFDALEVVLPTFTSATMYDAAFAAFCGSLAVAAAVVASWTRTRGASGRWRPGAGAALAVVGVVGLSVALGVFLVNAGVDYGPFLLVTGTAVVLLTAGWHVVRTSVGPDAA
ncbi:hypothetical protein [Halobaculum limi]|uniref:hypothetical protein n=1 Tax=Halobaculum limi TaxID=3031916 RepID=UPI002404F2F5|nr:hypothetical protein [Halobaculum sp. YSMS11]